MKMMLIAKHMFKITIATGRRSIVILHNLSIVSRLVPCGTTVCEDEKTLPIDNIVRISTA